jgi:hypothetical protein
VPFTHYIHPVYIMLYASAELPGSTMGRAGIRLSLSPCKASVPLISWRTVAPYVDRTRGIRIRQRREGSGRPRMLRGLPLVALAVLHCMLLRLTVLHAFKTVGSSAEPERFLRHTRPWHIS